MFVAALGIALIAIVVRLAQVQLVQGETFASAARANQIQLIPISAPRGLIVDRNGVVMVRSRPSFVCALIPSEVVNIDDTLHLLAGVLHIDEAKLRRRLYHHLGVNYKNFDRGRHLRTERPGHPRKRSDARRKPRSWPRANRRSRASISKNSRCATTRWERPARKCSATSARSPKTNTAARKNEGYSPNDVVGKDGLEETYDRGCADVSAASRSK